MKAVSGVLRLSAEAHDLRAADAWAAGKVDDVGRWLSSCWREEVFGRLGITTRTF